MLQPERGIERHRLASRTSRASPAVPLVRTHVVDLVAKDPWSSCTSPCAVRTERDHRDQETDHAHSPQVNSYGVARGCCRWPQGWP